jgi:hypothetical protein
VLTSAGNVGIGTSAPAVALDVVATTTSGIRLRSSSGASNGFNIFNNSSTDTASLINHFNGPMVFGTTNTERARIDASGNLLFKTTTSLTGTQDGIVLNRAPLQLLISRNNTASVSLVIFLNPNGVVGSIGTSGTATVYSTSSDYRLKENIVDAPSASENIDAIQIRSFDWKADGSHQKYGVVAQELEPIAPEAVSKGEKEDDMWGVDYSKLVPMLIKEVQSLRARVAQLEGN